MANLSSGFSMEYNSLSKEETNKYQVALYKMGAYIKNRDKAVELADGITLFSFFTDVKKEHVLYGLGLLRKENESYYQIIVKKHGENLSQTRSFSSKKENKR